MANLSQSDRQVRFKRRLGYMRIGFLMHRPWLRDLRARPQHFFFPAAPPSRISRAGRPAGQWPS
eukprot:11429874-Alexandrium_andersonii.AAC.1